jgi:hypothetical protein
MERIKAANAKATIDLRIHISLFVDVFSAASATIGRPQTELVFSSNARPPKGTIAAFDFTDVGTLRRQLAKESTPFSAGPAEARCLIRTERACMQCV